MQCGVVYCGVVNDDSVRRVVSALDDALDNRSRHLAHRQHAIDALKRQNDHSYSTNALNAIAEAYGNYDNDSALKYYDLAIRAAVPGSSTGRLLEARRSYLYSQSGFAEEALREFSAIDTTGFTPDEKAVYYNCGRRMYQSLASLYANYPAFAVAFNDSATVNEQRLLTVMRGRESSAIYRLMLARQLQRQGERRRAERLLIGLYRSETVVSPQRSEAARLLSEDAASRGDSRAACYYMAQSVLGDILAGDRELRGMSDLGMMMYEDGDVDHAYRYLHEAVDYAGTPMSMMRAFSAARSIPEVHNALLDGLSRSNRYRLAAVIVLSLTVAALLAVCLLLLRRQRGYSRRLARLTHANKAKEECLTRYIELCSRHMHNVDEFTSTLRRKIASGKSDDILRTIKTGKLAADENEAFFKVFDRTFLQLFPTFVDDVNALLRSDSRILLKEGERLNTDLRILAFMRMGIDDCSRIADMLGYSLNTIYAYRNKLKGRAINRDTFDADLMSIESI